MNQLVMDSLFEKDTAALGEKLGQRLFPGAFIALFGELGAGKTTLTRSLAEAMGIRGVLSPTFTIVREYTQGSLPLFHFDAYRLGSAEELDAIGFADYQARQGAIVMEWCENVAEALPPERLEIHLAGSGDSPRSARLVAFGKPYEAILEELS